MRLTSVVVLTVVGAVMIPGAWAEDLFPPVWRGQPGSTVQAWEFTMPDPVTAPELGFFNPYGTPSAHAWPGTGQYWVDLWGGRQGMWPLSGTIEIGIPNYPEPRPYKDIIVQLTWAKQVESSAPVVWDPISGMFGTLVQEIPLGPTGYPAPNNMWYHSVFQIHIEPNPAFETVKIDGTLVVDEVVIDTICVPEPGTLALLGMLGAALLGRRRAG